MKFKDFANFPRKHGCFQAFQQRVPLSKYNPTIKTYVACTFPENICTEPLRQFLPLTALGPGFWCNYQFALSGILLHVLSLQARSLLSALAGSGEKAAVPIFNQHCFEEFSFPTVTIYHLVIQKETAISNSLFFERKMTTTYFRYFAFLPLKQNVVMIVLSLIDFLSKIL